MRKAKLIHKNELYQYWDEGDRDIFGNKVYRLYDWENNFQGYRIRVSKKEAERLQRQYPRIGIQRWEICPRDNIA